MIDTGPEVASAGADDSQLPPVAMREGRQARLLKAVLLPREPETSTTLYEALKRIECAVCEGPIYTGDLYTRGLAEGHGRTRVPHCNGCRPFQVIGVKP